MAYDETLAARIRAALDGETKLVEKKMFGGVCFLVDGNMVCGVLQNEIIVRVGAENHDAALKKPFARVMDFSGRPMKGFVYVDAAGLQTAKQLEGWIESGKAYAATLPPKGVKPARKGKAKRGAGYVVAPVKRPKPRGK